MSKKTLNNLYMPTFEKELFSNLEIHYVEARSKQARLNNNCLKPTLHVLRGDASASAYGT